MRPASSAFRIGLLWLAVLVTAVSVAACNGGTSPVALPSTATSQALSPASGGTASLPASGGITGASVTFPASSNLPAGVSVTFNSSSSLKAPAPQNTARKQLSVSTTAFWQMTFTGSTLAGVTFNGNIVATIPTPSGATASSLLLEVFDGSKLANVCGSAASGSNTVFTCTNPQINLADTYWLEVVSGSSLALPAYCSNYSSFPTSGVPLNITDDSGLTAPSGTAVLVVYIQNGAQFMDNSGNFTAALPNPLPAACFSTTSGSAAVNRPLTIPTGVGGRIYFAYATPVPTPTASSNPVPNPFGAAPIGGPNAGAAAGYPWDKIEYGTTANAIIDTTQVDFVGLPLELSVVGGALPSARVTGHAQSARRPLNAYPSPAPCPSDTAASPSIIGASSIVGVTSCNYANIFNAMEQLSSQSNYYNQLVVTQQFNGQTLDMQVVAPKDAFSFTSFQWNLFALSQYVPSSATCTNGTANGYLSCVLAAYQTPMSGARLFQTGGIGAGITVKVNGVNVTINSSGDNYCATSDGTANFIFTDVGSATSCASATANPSPAHSPNPFKMPMQEFTFGTSADANGGCTTNILLSQPWGGANVDFPQNTVAPGATGHIFANMDAFALWKGLTADLNRGTMLTTTQTHPVGITNPSMSLFFQDPMFNIYAQIVHTYFNGNLAYALAYDDLGNFESGVQWEPGDPINVRINAVPTATQLSSAPAPVGFGPCTALPTEVGTF